MKKKHVKATNLFKAIEPVFGASRAVKIVRAALLNKGSSTTGYTVWCACDFWQSIQGSEYWLQLAYKEDGYKRKLKG